MKFSLFCLLLFFAGKSFAQLPLYYVYDAKGNASVTKAGQIKPARLVSKMFIYANDEVQINDTHTEIKLMGYDKKLLTLDHAGKWQASALEAMFKPSDPPVSIKYLQLVWNDIFHPHPQSSSPGNENIAASWGAAERDDANCDFGVYPLAEQNICVDSMVFRWNSLQGATNYGFAIFNAKGSIIYQEKVNDTTIVLKEQDWKSYATDSDYYWTVKPENSSCPLIATTEIYVYPRQVYINKLNSLIGNARKNKDSIIYQLGISDILYRKGFVDEAYRYYKQSGFK